MITYIYINKYVCVFVLAIKMFNLQRHSAQLPSWTRYPIVPMKWSPRVGTLSGTNLQVGVRFCCTDYYT